MPEQAPRKVSTALLLPIVLVTTVTVLSLPIIVELLRSLAITLNNQTDVSLSDLYIGSGRIALLIRSLAIAGFIGLVGVCMGIPIGRLISSRVSRRGQLLVAILISPMWLPATMVYAAGNLMRAPDTIVGRALITYSTSSEDLRWLTIWAGYTIAIVGLAIWSAPIAGLLIGSGMGFRSNTYDEMIALEPVGIARRSALWVRLHLGVLGRAWVLVTVIMLGSAVPMHLSQLETWSIGIWRQLAERPIDQWGTVWLSAWPMVFVGICGAWVLTRTVVGKEKTNQCDDRGHAGQRVPRMVMIAALCVWTLGALVPLSAMLVTLDDFGSLIQFWRLESGAMRDSGTIALVTGLLTIVTAFLVAITLGAPSVRIRRLGAAAVMMLCVLGFIPGVLIGAAVARSSLPGITDGWTGALLASCIRTAFLGAIIGAMCASAESVERKSIRWQIAGGSFGGWARTVLPGIWMPILGAGLIGSIYSMYEIEASVMVRPPGMDNLPQQLLSDLHYARLEQLSAAGVNLLIIGLACSIAASLLVTKVRPKD
jgi:ABC-type Fe3+ transport system permease subunit